MSLIKQICETCRYHINSNASWPCVECSSRDKWKAAEDIRVSTKKLINLEAELDHHKREAEKIPKMCRDWDNYNCICEIDNKLKEKYCPQICPKYRGEKVEK